MPYPLADDRGRSFSKAPGRCRAGWITACTTALCLQFDSPTLGPRFPIPRPIALLLGHIALGRITSHWVMSQHVRSCHSTSGCVTAHRVASQCIGLHRVASHCIGSRHVASGWVSHAIIRLVALLSGLSGALSLPAFVPLLCTLFPTTPCKGLTFTYTPPYLASVTVTLGTCPLL